MSSSFSDDEVGTSHVLRFLAVVVPLWLSFSKSSSFQCPSAWMLLASTFTLRIRVSMVDAVIAGALNGTAVNSDLVFVVVVVWCR